MKFPPIEDLLPHREPMLWIDEVVAREEEAVHCRATLRPEHVFVHDGRVEPVVTIELMAQTIGALVGLRDRQNNETPRPGYLIAIPEARFEVDTFLVGQTLDLHVRRVWGDDELASFECRVEHDGALAASAQISVYRRALPGSMQQ
jgi:predicted hotdog family 3-hydroxylacyl-ACP dehydratase